MKLPLTLEYWQDDGWYVGKLKEIPGVFSQGQDLAELEANMMLTTVCLTPAMTQRNHLTTRAKRYC